MLDDLVPLALFASLAYIIVATARIVSDGRTRRRLIDTGASPELASAVTATKERASIYESLRWGLVLGALGLGLIVVHFLPYGSDEPIAFGVVLLFAAAGLLTYSIVARRLTLQ